MPFVTRGDASLLEAAAHCASQPATQPPRRGLFASLGGGLFGGSAAAAQPVKDRRSGVEFAGEFCYLKKRDCPRVTGTGVRAKRLLGIKNIDVYAMALYVDPSEAKATLGGKFRGAATEELAQNQRLFDELVAAEGVEKTMQLVITSGLVKRQTFLDALAERLEPPMKKAGDTAALNQFKSLFEGVDFRKGLPLAFTATKKGLVTQVDGKEVGVVPSKAFVRAFFKMYVGRDPVSADAKQSFGQGLAHMVLS